MCCINSSSETSEASKISLDFIPFFLAVRILFFTYIFYKLKFKFLYATFFATLPVITFFLLKVHVQVRETLAIMLWMIAVLDIDKKNFFNLKNLFLFILSSFMHLSVLFWWIPSIIYSTKRFSNSIKLLLNSLLKF